MIGSPRLSSLLLLAIPTLVAGAQSTRPLVVHEWGTITTRHAADGTPQGQLNRIAPTELLPAFVHRFEPAAIQGATQGGRPPLLKTAADPGRADVTMRLETPVLYFHPDAGSKGGAAIHRGRKISRWHPERVLSNGESISCPRAAWCHGVGDSRGCAAMGWEDPGQPRSGRIAMDRCRAE